MFGDFDIREIVKFIDTLICKQKERWEIAINMSHIFSETPFPIGGQAGGRWSVVFHI